MPYYKLPYDRVVESESGHIVRFVKDTATYVPPVPMLLERVQMFGGTACEAPAPEDGEVKPAAKPRPANRE